MKEVNSDLQCANEVTIQQETKKCRILDVHSCWLKSSLLENSSLPPN